VERSDKTFYELGGMNEKAVRHLAFEIAKRLEGGEILLLKGDLGTGKTTFVKALAEGLMIDPDDVRSPTFTIVNTYVGRNLTLLHADLYRLSDPSEVLELDLLGLLGPETVLAVEWPELLAGFIGKNALKIELEYEDEKTRRLKLSGSYKWIERMVKDFFKKERQTKEVK